MGDTMPQWKTMIWLSDKEEDCVAIYAESIALLRKVAKEWLYEREPEFFRCGTTSFFYSDGTYPAHTSIKSRLGQEEEKVLEEGWYREDQIRRKNNVVTSHKIDDFETAVEEFSEKILPEKGPGYQDRIISDGKLQLHLVKTVKRVRQEEQVNEFLKRGWYLLSIDKSGEPDSQSVYSLYVLGHPEEDAV